MAVGLEYELGRAELNGHTVKMLIGCLLPLLLIFVLPLFGIGEGVTMFIFIILMFGCHLLMMGGHGGHKHGKRDKETDHESH